ncbi:hypothetical protein [Polaribacter tangerinus]|uniref:hypothetical protein n=1 Tax=Polaribacter tangerinus TaxID=1920034 RepID=UPI000B4AE769|nr:hypothetical protein [Polaribacter tangerinus]
MKKKYKFLLLLSNIILFIFVLNIFVKFIVFSSSYINFLGILGCGIANIGIALKASFEVANKE